MCNAHEMAKQFAEENKAPEERVMEWQGKEITRQAAKICALEKRRDDLEKNQRAATVLAAIEAFALMVLICVVLGLLK